MPDETRLEGATAAVKFDADKPRLDLLPVMALEDVAGVFAYGSQKYGDNQWRSGFRLGRLYAAVLRHLFAWMRGEDSDPESGKPHLAHAACQLLMALELIRMGRAEDDRFKDVTNYQKWITLPGESITITGGPK